MTPHQPQLALPEPPLPAGPSRFARALLFIACVDKAVAMDLARLDRKLAAMRDHGTLTGKEQQQDEEEREEIRRLVTAGLDGLEAHTRETFLAQLPRETVERLTRR